MNIELKVNGFDLEKEMRDLTNDTFREVVKDTEKSLKDEVGRTLPILDKNSIRSRIIMGASPSAQYSMQKSHFSSSDSLDRDKDGNWYLPIPKRQTSPTNALKQPNTVQRRVRSVSQWGRTLPTRTPNPSTSKGTVSRSKMQEAYFSGATSTQNSGPMEDIQRQIPDTFSKVFANRR